MADTETSPAMLLDELANLNPQGTTEMAAILHPVAQTSLDPACRSSTAA